MYTIKFFDQFGDYEERTFKDRNKYITFLDWCTANEIQVLEHTDTYMD